MNSPRRSENRLARPRLIPILAWSTGALNMALALGGLLLLYLNRRTPLAVATFYSSEMVVGLVFGSIGADETLQPAQASLWLRAPQNEVKK